MPATKGLWSKLRGYAAESSARRYLEGQGLNFIQKNYLCRQGEIDLIMQDGAEWVFVEVKFRHNQQHGRAEEYFHANKRRKFEKAVLHFLHSKHINPAHVPFRIDVVAINKDQLSWFKCV
ncbi:YraN family protein [Aestuariibacter sp. AA17]|uniref:UPF0102 protein OE749_02280 n=1 Tax=Fluctibacter corallii TaxID=2984329 RepID=A0ABT3A4C0_9ALTE|nr:YraN family protein [Aestuariibacter sp. AA17]MCV2883525.1 YraN family protein [Aestuariibacter sp. AA17]